MFRGIDMGFRNPFFHRSPGRSTFVPALLLAFAFCAPAKADFLEDLFGGGFSEPPPAPRAHAVPRDNFSIKLRDTRKSHKKPSGPGDGAQYVAGSRPQKPLLCAVQTEPEDKRGESTAYLRDETLRAGDSIVTPGEIVVFKGGGGCPHASGDFVSLSRSGLPVVKRNALVSLQQGLKSPRNLDDDDDQPSDARTAGGAKR